ncbi:MAG: hypothetical protein FWB96_03475 [Defluviitaleaceae bacterium]|nr:hypothetical protein [Defluviitaleaceae bacterium]MCL2261740.1 hypothetical protein [Defluviitaleaceae bacterium]
MNKCHEDCTLGCCVFNYNFRCTLPNPPMVGQDGKKECMLIWLTTPFFSGANFLKCETEICIYNENKTCNLENPPSIGECGICESFELVTVDEQTLQTAKNFIREQRAAQYASWTKTIPAK